MNKWIRADVDFGQPMVVFTVPWRVDELWDIYDSMPPDALASRWQDFIDKCRPELRGGSILAMNTNFRRQEWELIYTHPSLPRTAVGITLPAVPLIPEVKPDAVLEKPLWEPESKGL